MKLMNLFFIFWTWRCVLSFQ